MLDVQGSVVALTDANGVVKASYSYDAWGNTLSTTSSATTGDGEALNLANPFRYSSHYFDETSGLYYLNARYCSPELGKFLSEDRLAGTATNPLSLNKYGYCYSNPTNYVDPDGNIAIFIPLAIYFTAVFSSPDFLLDAQQFALDVANGEPLYVWFLDLAAMGVPGLSGLGQGARVADDVVHAAKTVRTGLPEILNSQVGKKLARHAADYGLSMSRAGADAYEAITRRVLTTATEIRVGDWKDLVGCEFWFSGADVAIVHNGKWISTFPLSKLGTIEYLLGLPLKE